VEVETGQADLFASLDPDRLVEIRAAQLAALRSDKDEPPLPRLSEPLEVPSDLGDLEDDWQRDNLPFVRLLFTCPVDVARVVGNDAIVFGRRLEDGVQQAICLSAGRASPRARTRPGGLPTVAGRSRCAGGEKLILCLYLNRYLSASVRRWPAAANFRSNLLGPGRTGACVAVRFFSRAVKRNLFSIGAAVMALADEAHGPDATLVQGSDGSWPPTAVA
jgi:hypothetical protein